MAGYQEALLEHLSSYAAIVVKPSGYGTYRGQPYPHILPPAEANLNLVEPYRAKVLEYLDKRLRIKRHMYFHHLNSSQAFAFNLFLPYFLFPDAAPMLADALGEEGQVRNVDFEVILDPAEATNIDVAWQRDAARQHDARTYCEVKLSESGFGTAKADERHKEKLRDIYRPRLTNMVADELLEESRFFRHYQILRNIALLHTSGQSRLLFLFPRRNEALERELRAVMPHVAAECADRVRVRYVEDVLAALRDDSRASEQYRLYAAALCQKYLPA